MGHYLRSQVSTRGGESGWGRRRAVYLLRCDVARGGAPTVLNEELALVGEEEEELAPSQATSSQKRPRLKSLSLRAPPDAVVRAPQAYGSML